MRDEHDGQDRPPGDRDREGRDGGVVVFEAVAHPLGEASGTGLEQALMDDSAWDGSLSTTAPPGLLTAMAGGLPGRASG